MAKLKPVYAFEEADFKNRMLLGGKGAGLSEMTRLKLPVPPGFTITTEVCNKYYENGKKLPKDVMPLVMKNVAEMEKKTGKKWNSTKLLCGAGIVSGEDVARAKQLGSKGILVASGIVKAKNWEKIIEECSRALV